MKKLIIKEWSEVEKGRWRIKWVEWDGACLCSAFEREDTIQADNLVTREDVRSELRKKVYGYHS